MSQSMTVPTIVFPYPRWTPCLALCLTLCAGCHGVDLSAQKVSPGGTGVSVTTAPETVSVKAPVNATIQPNGVGHTEGTLNVAAGAVQAPVTLTTADGAVRITGSATGTVQPGAIPVNATMTDCGKVIVAEGAVPVTLQANVAENAVHFILNVKIEKGAVQNTGVDASAWTVDWKLVLAAVAIGLLIYWLGHHRGSRKKAS